MSRKNRENAANRKAFVFRRDRGLCQFCGRAGATLDHLTPKMRGGDSTRHNLVVACLPCNRRKGFRFPLEFFFGVTPKISKSSCVGR